MDNVNPTQQPLLADTSISPKAKAEYDLGWWEATIDASYWWAMKDLSPRNAALLLTGTNPRDDTTDPTKTSSDETTAADYVRLVEKLNDEYRAAPAERTLAQWLCIAQGSGLRYHSWIDKWMKGSGLTAVAPAQSHVGTTTGKLPAGTQIVTSKEKGRSRVLDSAVTLAKEKAGAHADYHTVWEALVALASSNDRPPPIVEFVDDEGVKYMDNGKVKIFTKDSLLKRINPSAR
ncbi:hypothetical protein SIM88_29940 [Cupriavidus necator]|nr:hypothetical protein [Cupriavidus necator]MDX6012857.1 hypothetical protein [Cupriavidus necator]